MLEPLRSPLGVVSAETVASVYRDVVAPMLSAASEVRLFGDPAAFGHSDADERAMLIRDGRTWRLDLAHYSFDRWPQLWTAKPGAGSVAIVTSIEPSRVVDVMEKCFRLWWKISPGQARAFFQGSAIGFAERVISEDEQKFVVLTSRTNAMGLLLVCGSGAMIEEIDVIGGGRLRPER